MEYKKISRDLRGEVGREAERAPDLGRRRRFLTTVAAAGAMVALLGVGSPAAQERVTVGATNPWESRPAQAEPKEAVKAVDGDSAGKEDLNPGVGASNPEEKPPARGKTFAAGNAYDMSVAPARKTISSDEAGRLVENAKNNEFVPPVNIYDAGEALTFFRYGLLETEKGVALNLGTRGGGFREHVFFPEAKDKGDVGMSVFRTDGNASIQELIVASADGKLAVFIRGKDGVPLVAQVSSERNQRPLNFFEDGDVKPLKQAIGYENKGGEITIISLPEKPEDGDSVLMMKISRGGILNSGVLELKTEAIVEVPNPF